MRLCQGIKKWVAGGLIPVLLLLPQLLLATHSVLDFSDQAQQEHQAVVALLTNADHGHGHDHDDLHDDLLQERFHGHNVADHIQETVQTPEVMRWSAPVSHPWRGAYHYSLKPTHPSPPKRPPRVNGSL